MNTEFTSVLLRWYERHGRELPWRNTTDAYRIWISEIILQQTRVAQGYDYFLRFMSRFPDVETLADASMDEVLKYWQGLGYYSRARNLYAAAQQIKEIGQFPADYDGVRSLKGVGGYTAAAIVSFAYGLPHAVVDGNVYRVLSRVFSIDTPIDSSEGKKTFTDLAQELLYTQDPGKYNQAIMDFGALQCTPKSPDCSSCPLASMCLAKAEGRVEHLPVKSHVTKVRDRYFTYFYIRFGKEILIRQRLDNDIWKGLFEVPLIETDHALILKEIDDLGWTNGRVTLLKQGVKHQLSHQSIHADFYLMECDKRPLLDGLWIKEKNREHYAVSKLMSLLFASVDGGDV